jgi:hypothetical protein
MQTNGRRGTRRELPIIQDQHACNFEGYDAISLMTETAKLKKLITKRGTLEILIPIIKKGLLCLHHMELTRINYVIFKKIISFSFRV